VTIVKEIPAKLVAALRARTGAGMMDCKKALEETAAGFDVVDSPAESQAEVPGRPRKTTGKQRKCG